MSVNNSVNITFNTVGGVLTIEGNTQDNTVRHWTGANGTLELEIDGQRYSSDRNSPFFSETLKDVNSSTLSHIQFDGGAGIDTLVVADQTLSSDLTIQGDEVVDVDGTITAAGTFAITADAVSVDGDISAQEITLHGVETTEVTGTLTALEGDLGGTIHILGDRVQLQGATVDASGANGGGTILIGGDYQGQGTIPTATFTQIDGESFISADALVQGDGGRVIVWSDDTTDFSGGLSAQGGASAGNGGFVEISGKALSFDGQVNVLAPNGVSGSVLFDPIDIVISDANGADGANGGSILTTDSPATEPWYVTPAQLDAVGGNVTLQATNDITVTDAIILSTAGASITLQAGNEIILNADITTNNGDHTYDGALSLGADATLDAGSGNVTFNSTIDGGQSLTVNSSGTTTFGGKVGDTVEQLVNLTTDAAGTTVLSAAGSSNTAGKRSFSLTGDATFNDAVTVTTNTSIVAGDDITFNSTLDGSKGLIFQVGSGHTLTFGDDVGASTPINNMQIANLGTTLIKGDSVATTTLQRYTNNVEIDSPSDTVTLTASSGAVRLQGSTIRSVTDGEDSLVINTGGEIEFDVASNSSQRLNNLTLNSDSDSSGDETINITSSAITTTGNQTYDGGVLLGANTTFTSDSNVTFNSTVQGETSTRNLTVDVGAATIDFNDAVGGASLINNIDLTAGLVSVDGAITAQGDITATTDTIAINQAITGTGNLTIAPQTADLTIGVGNGSTGTLNLDATELANLTDGFSGIIIGNSTSGTVDIVNASVTDPLTLAGSTLSDSSSGNDITGDVTFEGTVAPGGTATSAIDQLVVNGDVAFAAGALLSLQLNGSGLAGTNYDQLQVLGAVDLSNVSLGLGLGYTPSVGETLTIVDNDGSDAISGTFDGLAEGATVTADGFSFQISYVGGDGNDVTLSAINSAPTISGTVSAQTVDDTTTLTPFSSVAIDDSNGDNVSVTVTLDDANKGVFTVASLSAAGFVDAGSGIYTLASTTTAAAQAALQQLVFDPTDNRVAPNLTETSAFTISVNDGTETTNDASTTVVSTSINDAPVLTIPTGITVNEDSTNNTIAGISIADNDGDDQTVVIGVTNGTISLNGDNGLGFTFGDGTDDSSLIFNGSLADVNTALNNLTFDPTADFAGNATIQIQTTDASGADTSETITVAVNDAPEVSSLVIGDTSPTNASTVTFDVTLSESVTGVDATDFALGTTGTASGNIASVSGSGTSYTVTVNSLSGEGTLGLNLVDDDSIINGNSVALGGVGTAGSGDGSFTGGTYTIDTTLPAAPSTPDLAATSDTGSTNTDNITASTTPALTGTAEANSTVTVTSDVDGVIGSAIANSSGDWAIVASTLTAGNHSITATATDSFGNVSTASGALSITVDTAAPTVAISSTAPTPTNASPIPVTLTFSEVVSDFVIGDVTVGNGTASNFATSDNQTFTLDVTPTGDGTVTVDVAANVAQDTAGNNNAAATQFSISSDLTAPTLTSFVRQTPADSTTNADSLVFLASFSEDVQNVDTADFTVNGSTTATVTNVSQTSASTYEVTLSGGDLASFNGTVGLNLAGGQNITDDAGNALPAGEPTTDETYTVDNTSPTVSLTSAAADPINSTFSVTATFSEATADFTDTDILVTNGSVSNFSGSGTTYTFDVTPTADGAVDVDIAGGVATDAAGNANTAATTLSRTFDATAPTVSLTSAAANPINSTFSVTATFNEATTNFTDTDISVTNGSVSNFSGSGTTYTFDVTPTADGTVDVNVAGGVATDAAGNSNTAATTLSRTFDATAPTVTLTSAATNPINSTFSVTTTFNETTTDFTDADISVTNGSVSNFSGSGTTYTFDVTPTADGAVDVDIAGGVATDAAGNANTAATTLSRTFDATAPTVTNVTPNLTSIVDSNVGTGTFTLTVDFSEAMDTSVNPTLSFPTEDPTSTLTPNSGSWSDSDTYIAIYDVADANETVSDIDVQVSGTQDTAGNLLTPLAQTDKFSISTASTIEFAAASFTADETILTSNAVTLIRTGDTSDTASVQVNITGGSAADADYTSSGFPLTVTFDPTETSKTVAIPIIDDLLVEGDETILLSISSASNATIGSQSTATLTITDNDTAGFILDKTNVTVSEAGSTETFNITLGSEPGSDVVLNITGSDPSEATVAPTSVTLNSTNWDTGVEVTITGEDDTEVDGDQTSTLSVSVDADNSDDAFDGLSDQTLSVNTIDDDTLALLTPVPAVSVLEVTSLGTANTVRLEVEAVGVDSVSEILILSTDAAGASRTQIGRFSLLEGGKLPAAYVPEFTVNNSAVEQGDYLQFELIENGQTRVATLTSIDNEQVALDFGDGTQLIVSLFDQTSTTNLLIKDASAVDLTGLDGQTVNIEFAVYREAKFDNTLRFYRTDFADGGIVTDPLTGAVLRPGEAGYEQAAINRQLEIEITGQNNQVNTFAATIDGGDYLGMFLIVDGNDPATSEVYFSHAGVNENQTDRAKLLGDNTFGFEDLPNLGDRDFDDIVVEFAIS